MLPHLPGKVPRLARPGSDSSGYRQAVVAPVLRHSFHTFRMRIALSVSSNGPSLFLGIQPKTARRRQPYGAATAKEVFDLRSKVFASCNAARCQHLVPRLRWDGTAATAETPSANCEAEEDGSVYLRVAALSLRTIGSENARVRI